MLSVLEGLVDLEVVDDGEGLSSEGRKVFEEALLEAKRRKSITYVV